MPTHLIDNRWQPGQGAAFTSLNPATGEPVWEGHAASAEQVDTAIAAARRAAENWGDTSLDTRVELLQAFANELENQRDDLAEAISLETGKPPWEAKGEVGTMIAKVPTTIEAWRDRMAVMERDLGAARGMTRYKPHGVLAVFGPFNFPGHLPNGHIVPALLAGNTVVFKPSELAPLVAQQTLTCWLNAGLPAGVINLIQGARDTGVGLANHAGHDGILFTGSLATGLALQHALANHPEKMLALEMGGNNPLIVHEVGDVDAAALATIQSAYATAGQRCTCARRLVVPQGEQGDQFIEHLVRMIPRVRMGPPTDRPEPFAGPLISRTAADRALHAQQTMLDRGAATLHSMERLDEKYGALLSPGLLDVTTVSERDDNEIFGPLLQLIRVPDFDAAIAEANRTAYGLVAGLLSDSSELYDRFYRRARAGLINFNRPTTGASGKLPFGGVGKSGNHRPSGYFAVDYCAYPVASLEAETLTLPENLPPGIDK